MTTTPLFCRRVAEVAGLYTFASPHVGNSAFIDSFFDKIPQSWRLYNRADVVPYLFAYVPHVFKHKGHGVTFLPKGRDCIFSNCMHPPIHHGQFYEDLRLDLGLKSTKVAECIEEQQVMQIAFHHSAEATTQITLSPGRPIIDEVRLHVRATVWRYLFFRCTERGCKCLFSFNLVFVQGAPHLAFHSSALNPPKCSHVRTLSCSSRS